MHDFVSCPMCEGPGVPLGSLGTREVFRCRNCGWDFSFKPEPETEAETALREVLDGDGGSVSENEHEALVERARCFFNGVTAEGWDAEYHFRDGSRLVMSGPGIDTPEGWEAAR